MITLVYAYYENADMLREHLKTWLVYIDFCKIIVVDDGSPTKPAGEVLKEAGWVHPNLQLYRIKPNIPWNQDGARNLAMKHAATTWAFMTDMDHLVPVDQLEKLTDFAALHAKPRHYYMPNQSATDGTSLMREHPNTYLMRVEDFWAMGGYDEDFAGHYGSDGNFRRCAIMGPAKLTEKKLMQFHTVVYRPRDVKDANTKDWGRKGSPFHAWNDPKLFAKMKAPAYKASNPIRFEWERIL